MTTKIFHAHKIKCNACAVIIEDEIVAHPSVRSVKVSVASKTVAITGDFGQMSDYEIAKELSTKLSEHILSTEPEKQSETNVNEFLIAIPIAISLGAGFFILQKIGLVNIIDSEKVSFGMAFLIGIIASLSTCMAVVGGIVLSVSATLAKFGNIFVPMSVFHIARLAAFFILGGFIGGVGSNFILGSTGTFVLGIFSGVIMLVLGIHLLDILSISKYIPSMPSAFSKKISSFSSGQFLTPILAGIATFFLPCGFTQSMQIYTLTSGNFLNGGLLMLSFALGTFPVLALMSFGAGKFTNNKYSGIFFKTSGIVVIMFALINILGALATFGIIKSINI